MSNDKPANPAADQLAKGLKSSLANQRPRTWLPIVVLLILCTLILGVLLWWFLPRGRPPVLHVVAFDDVVATGETPTARGQLFVPTGDAEAPRLSGHDLAFDDQQTQPKVIKSDDKGIGAAAWPIGEEPVAAFFVRFVDRDNRQGSAKENGRLFVWPKNSRIIVVDADETLLEDNEHAPTVLNKAADEGWRIAFACITSSKAHEFRQARGRLDSLVKLPKGPYLGRAAYPAKESVEAARREVFQLLRGKFNADMLAIIKSADATTTCQDLGIRVIRIGDAATPTWAEVVVK
jgi:hypothetical protein